MAPPVQRRSREVIDLTVDDDDDAVRQNQPPPTAPPPAFANGIANRAANSFVDSVPLGGFPFYDITHAHPHAPPRPAQEQPFYQRHAPDAPDFAPSPPAKRQKLSDPPRGMNYDEQVITKSVGIHLSPYARDAAEALNNKNIDEDKLKAEVSRPLQDTGTVLSHWKALLTSLSRTDPKNPYRPVRIRNSTEWAPSRWSGRHCHSACEISG